jgi:hypothetical protein
MNVNTPATRGKLATGKREAITAAETEITPTGTLEWILSVGACNALKNSDFGLGSSCSWSWSAGEDPIPQEQVIINSFWCA